MNTIKVLISLMIINFFSMSVLAGTNKLEEKPDSKELKVLSFNLGIVAFFNKEKYTKRAKQFCDILKKENYDVVLLQESGIEDTEIF